MGAGKVNLVVKATKSRSRRPRYSKWKSIYRRKMKPTSTLVRGNNPFPDKYKTKLRYIDDININGALGYQFQVYRANSLYDPDFTGVGHQPMGFDALCGAPRTNAPYMNYLVKDCYIRVDVINTSATVPFYLVLYASKETTIPASITEGFEQPYSKWCVVPINSSNPSRRLYKKMTTGKIFGETPSAINSEDNYSAAYNSSPNDIWYWGVYAVACDGASAITGRIRVELIFNTEFSDRNQLQQS